MKNKFFLTMFLAIVVICFLPSMSASAAFKDVAPNVWTTEHILSLYSEGIIKGYEDGTFRPNLKVTRAQAAIMIVKSLNKADEGLAVSKARFSDVPISHPSSRYIERAAQLGIINGRADGSFGPGEPITRAQISIMLAKAYKLTDGKNIQLKFVDIPTDYYAREQIASLFVNGIISGDEKNQFNPGDHTTRAHFSAMTDKLLRAKKPITSEVKPINIGSVTPSSLNVRQGPSENSTRIGYLQQGEQIEVYDKIGSWLKINYRQQIGFIHGGYVELSTSDVEVEPLEPPNTEPEEPVEPKPSEPKPSEPKPSEPQKAMVTASTLNVRAGAGTNFAVIGSLAKGSIVDINEVSNGWGKITYNGKVAYISMSHVSIINTTPAPPPNPNQTYTIVIDAGHGAHDPGTTGFDAHEKDIVLEVAKKLEQKFRGTNFNIIMTRQTDVFLTLQERSDIANKANADAFVSIHVNAGPETANGTETYWHQKYSSAESKELAEKIQAELIKELKTRDRGVKEGNFHVIRETFMASVLVEIGFLSNEEEAMKLQDPLFQDKAAQAIYNGIVAYFDNK